MPLKLSEGIYKRLLDDEMAPALYAQFVAQLLQQALRIVQLGKRTPLCILAQKELWTMIDKE